MALINRLSRLFQADAHAVLDRIEEPVALLRMAIRDMEKALLHDRRNCSRLTHEIQTQQRRLCDIENSLEKMQGELDLCLDHDKGELARSLIRRKIEQTRVCTALTRRLEDLQQLELETSQRIDANQGRLDSMRQKADLYRDPQIPGEPAELTAELLITVTEDDVELALLQALEDRERS